MSTSQQLPENHPLRIAWEQYKASATFANSKHWAVHPEHTDGSLWTAFVAGYDAAQQRCIIESDRRYLSTLIQQKKDERDLAVAQLRGVVARADHQVEDRGDGTFEHTLKFLDRFESSMGQLWASCNAARSEIENFARAVLPISDLVSEQDS